MLNKSCAVLMINFEGTRRKFFFLSFVFFFYIYINRRSNRMFIENKRKKLTSTYTKFTVISDFRLRSRRTVACVSNRLSADYRNKTSNRELKRAKGYPPALAGLLHEPRPRIIVYNPAS